MRDDRPLPPPPAGSSGSCAICGDAAVDAEVIEPLGRSTARVRIDGCEAEVATDLVGAVRRGDRLLVHLGFAIARLEQEAR